MASSPISRTPARRTAPESVTRLVPASSPRATSAVAARLSTFCTSVGRPPTPRSNGRGGCKHPDGAAGLLRSALGVFADDYAAHQRGMCLRSAPLVGRPLAMAEAVA
ncbi:MAG: hypothetical protein E6I74_04585 [Chloroflexi bacterium]|nr:MAG: hypothetical protein E6I74_04585 [Chloroflexota bacterium]